MAGLVLLTLHGNIIYLFTPFLFTPALSGKQGRKGRPSCITRVHFIVSPSADHNFYRRGSPNPTGICITPRLFYEKNMLNFRANTDSTLPAYEGLVCDKSPVRAAVIRDPIKWTLRKQREKLRKI